MKYDVQENVCEMEVKECVASGPDAKRSLMSPLSEDYGTAWTSYDDFL